MQNENTQTQITTQEPKRLSFSQAKQNALDNQLAAILPPHIDKEFFKKVFGITLASNPKFEQCDQTSLNSAICRCAEIGVLPNGRQAVLIPYGNKCEYQIMVAGFIEILDKAGVRVYAENVYSNDSFKRTGGDNPAIHHAIDDFNPRGEYRGTYAVFKDKATGDVIGREFIGLEDMAKIKAKSQNSNAWKDFEDEMRKKSVIKRGAKRLSLSPIIDKAIDSDNEINGFKPEEKNVTPVEAKVSEVPSGLIKSLGLKKASELPIPEPKKERSIDDAMEESLDSDTDDGETKNA